MQINTLIKKRRAFVRRVIQMTPDLEMATNNSHSFEDNLKKHIFAHLHEADLDIDIDILSQLMFMSRETLRRKCQTSMVISPYAHIQKVRLQQAKLLLEQDKMNVSEVAYAEGFDRLSHFSKSFKKYYGQPPSGLAINQDQNNIK
jgi:AraC-like DNA-binding protein